MLEQETIDILGISESWLYSGIEDSELNINGYHKIIRNDRQSDRYGGVAIYCNTNYTHIDRKEWNVSCNDIEIAWLEIILPQSRPLYICTVYRTEHSLRAALDTLEEQVDKVISTHGNPEVIIMSDFNVDYLNRNHEVKQLKSFELLYQLNQKLSTPTRVTDKGSTCKDHMYTNREEMLSETYVIPLGLSDHSLTYIVRKGKKNKLRLPSFKLRLIEILMRWHLTMTWIELIGQEFIMLTP